MKLQDFLKCKKVRCVKAYDDCLKIGKEYSVLNIRMEVEVRDDEGGRYYWESDHFEPVLDSAENPLQGVELTPEFEAVEPITAPRFEAGQKAYCPWLNVGRLVLLESNHADYLFAETVKGRQYFNNDGTSVNVTSHAQPDLFHATQENYELLCKLIPWVNFEAPPKPLTGIELAKKLIAKGHNYLVVDTVIGIRVLTRLEGNTLIDSNNVRLDELDDITPLNDETGEPLTEAVLDE
nr:hypothetical protein [Moraxella sp.]